MSAFIGKVYRIFENFARIIND